MNDYVMKDNSGAIFSNDKKEKDSHPDFRGDVLVNGKKMQLSAWKKQGRNGEFFSLSFQEPYVKPEGNREVKTEKTGIRPVRKDLTDDNFDSDIPF